MKFLEKQMKRKSRFYSFYCLIFIAFPLFSYGQIASSENNFGRLSAHFSIGNHSVGFPYQNQFSAINPAIDLGIAFRINKSTTHRLLTGIASTYTHNEVVGNSLKIGANLNYRYTHSSGMFGQFGVDIGSITTNYSRSQYQFNSTNETYELVNQNLNTSYSGFRTMIGYDFVPKYNNRYAVFLAHQFYFQTPYFPVQSFSILPQNIIQIGVSIQVNKLNNH